jgi:L-arabinokinase
VHLLFYISGHGFGHAARDIEIINAVAERRPDVQITLRTNVPEWFLRESLERRVECLPGDVDTGLVQPDGLTIDEDETARQAAAFYDTFPARVSQEVDIIRALDPMLVVGDIPPLASAAADAAGVPSVAVGNFTWDWIYQAYPQFARLAPGVIERIADAYARTSFTLRLPFSGGFAAMSRVESVPLVARHARTPRDITRERLGLGATELVVLASFGGHGGNIPLDAAAASNAFTLVTTGYEASKTSVLHSRVRVASADVLRRAVLTYTDLLAASDVVVSKLGYGIVSECLANNVPLLFTLRGRFIEQDVFVHDMPAVMRCRHIAAQDLRDGHWAPAVDALLAQPRPPQTLPTTGAGVVADRILAIASGG